MAGAEGTPARPWADSGSDCRSRAMGGHDLGEPVIRSRPPQRGGGPVWRRSCMIITGGLLIKGPQAGVRSVHGLADRDNPAGRSRAGAGRCGPVAGPPAARRRNPVRSAIRTSSAGSAACASSRSPAPGGRPMRSGRRRSPWRARCRCWLSPSSHGGGRQPGRSPRRASRSPSAARPCAGSRRARTARSSASRSTVKPRADDFLRPR